MAGKRKAIIRFINAHFNKFFSDAITNIPDGFNRFFNSKERLDLYKGRSGLLNGILEEKLYYLGKLGYRFALIIADSKKKHNAQSLLKMIRIFREKASFNKKGAITELKEAGVFVLSDVDFVRSMSVISGIYGNEELFNVVRSYSGINEKMYKFQQANKEALLEQTAMNNLDSMFTRVMMAGTFEAHKNFFLNQFKVTAREYVVLAFVSKNRYCKFEEIARHLNMVRTYSAELTSLIQKGFVEEITIHQYKEYYITGTGEVVLNSIRQYFLEPTK